MADLLPSMTPLATLFANGTLPEIGAVQLQRHRKPAMPPSMAYLAVPANPLFAAGFGTSNLVTNNFRLAYVLDAVANPDGAVPAPTRGRAPGRQSAEHACASPSRPMTCATGYRRRRVLMCGGDQDPTVFFSVNTQVMQQYWAALPPGRSRSST